jgi:hypothetical protein
VRREAANRVTINCCYQRQCGAVGAGVRTGQAGHHGGVQRGDGDARGHETVTHGARLVDAALQHTRL